MNCSYVGEKCKHSRRKRCVRHNDIQTVLDIIDCAECPKCLKQSGQHHWWLGATTIFKQFWTLLTVAAAAICQINNAITRIISISVNGGRCELTRVRMYVINNAITQLISISVNGGLANLRNAQNIILVYIRQPLAAAIMSWVPSIMVWRSAAAIAAPH